MNGKLDIFNDEPSLFHAAANTFVALAEASIAERGRFTVALSGGSTPKALYQLLASEAYRGRVAWEKVDWFFGDERSVGLDDPESNYRMAREAILAPVNAPPQRVHRIRGEHDRPAEAAAEYAAQLAKVFGTSEIGPPPPIDLVLLGMGNDGHTASLFPFTQALHERRKWVVANDVPQLHTRRYTLTYPIINAAGCVLFLITGVGKAKVLQEVLEGPPEPERLPSQAVAPAAGRLLWYVDRAAASRLES
jgi:6-phosphogluconolactonase